jgi:hypothetical protein
MGDGKWKIMVFKETLAWKKGGDLCLFSYCLVNANFRRGELIYICWLRFDGFLVRPRWHCWADDRMVMSLVPAQPRVLCHALSSLEVRHLLSNTPDWEICA